MKKEELLKLYFNYRLYIFPAIAVISSLILISLVIFPEANKLLRNQRVEQEISKKSKFLEVKAQSLENYDSADLNAKVGHILNSYPAEKDFGNVVGLLQNLTAQAGFNITSLSVGGLGKAPKLQSYAVKLDLLGSIKFLPVLINNIEHSFRLMRVSSIETTAGKDPQSAVVSLNVEVLYGEIPKEFGSTDSPLPELSQKDEAVLAALAEAAPNTFPQKQASAGASLRGKANPFE